MISQETIAQVRGQVDILALVSEFVALKRSGSSHKGLCPFHAEKSPSFHVHPARGYFYCFGCHASGDAIAFWMRIQGLQFTDAVTDLASRMGIHIQQSSGGSSSHQEAKHEKAHRERLAHVLELSTAFFVSQLSDASENEKAAVQKVFEDRRLGTDMIKKFRLGYAPSDWQRLFDYLKHQGCSPRECEEAGVIVARQSNGFYDRFRQRIMFPVTDVHGHVIAFSGRSVDGMTEQRTQDKQHDIPKYVNSPETLLYKKGEALYGLFESRLSLRRYGWAVLCEGNFDVVALHQAGFDNAVAPLGTALTEAQAKLLRRFVERVVVCFDGDAAGLKATQTACTLLDHVGLETRIANLPEGHDPDSFIRTYGRDRMQVLLDEAPTRIFWLIDHAAEQAGSHPSKRAEAIRELGPVIGARKSPVEVRMYIDRIMQRFELDDEKAVRSELRKGLGRPANGATRPSRIQPQRQGVKPNTKLLVWPEGERELVGALVDQPGLLTPDLGKKLAILLTDARSRSILEVLHKAMEQGVVESKGLVDVVSALQAPQEARVRRWFEQRMCEEVYDASEAQALLSTMLHQLEKNAGRRQLQTLAKEIQEAQKTGDIEQANRLRIEHLELARKLQGKGSKAPNG